VIVTSTSPSGATDAGEKDLLALLNRYAGSAADVVVGSVCVPGWQEDAPMIRRQKRTV
jgi:hypothetical protein